LDGSGRFGRRRSGRRTRRRAPVAEEEDGDLGVESARLGLQVQGEGDEDAPAVLFFSLAWRGVVGVVASVKHFERRPWRSGVGKNREGRRGKRRRCEGVRVRAGRCSFISPGGSCTAAIARS
jgi:hypothetical protein